MKMKRKLYYGLFLMTAILLSSNLQAQVTIGTGSLPPGYSLLELDAANTKGGLHLPMLTTLERDALTLDASAAGLVIFNTSINCVEFWNGSSWVSQCYNNSYKEPLSEAVPSKRYRLYGKILYTSHQKDITTYGYPADYPNPDDFANGTALTFKYVFQPRVYGSLFSNLQYTVADGQGLLASYTSSGVNNDTVTFVFDYAAVKTKTANLRRTNAAVITLTALFNDNAGKAKKVSLDIRVQDEPVGCSVRKVNDPTLSTPSVNGWLTFMCYNMGADPMKGDPTAQKSYTPTPNTGASGDATVYGDHYQWGRIEDGHQVRDLATENIWPAGRLGQTTGFAADPVPFTSLDPNHQVIDADIRFGKFIRRNTTETPAGNGDWIAGAAGANNFPDRWGNGTENDAVKVKSPADPCPAGWRIPTRTEWASIYGTITNCTSGATCYSGAKVNKWAHNFAVPPAGDAGTHGVSITPSTTAGGSTYGSVPTLFLPAGDDRNYDHATIDSSGTTSIYWSSTVTDTAAYFLYCHSSYVAPSDVNARAYGFSVRCVAE
jgi:uncharacterized protein (TIGR02145 family)